MEMPSTVLTTPDGSTERSLRSVSKTILQAVNVDYRELVKDNLTPDLLDERYRWIYEGYGRYAGYCYVASEAYYHLEGRKLGFDPCCLEPDGDGLSVHWYLATPEGVIVDLTAEQFDEPPDYSQGTPLPWLPPSPSKEAQDLITRVRGCIRMQFSLQQTCERLRNKRAV